MYRAGSLHKGTNKQKYELWLQHSTEVLKVSGLGKEQWGVALLSAVDSTPQQRVYERLNDAAARAPGDEVNFSWEHVTSVMQGLFASRETPEEWLEQLQQLELKGPTPEDLESLRNDYMSAAGHLRPEDLSGRAKCSQVTGKLPGPVKMCIKMETQRRGPEGFTEVDELFDAARDTYATLGPEIREWWDSHVATKAKGKRRTDSPTYSDAAKQPFQPAAKVQRTASGGSQPSRLGKPGLPEVPGKTAAEVKAFADAHPGACLLCGSTAHRFAHCCNELGLIRPRVTIAAMSALLPGGWLSHACRLIVPTKY